MKRLFSMKNQFVAIVALLVVLGSCGALGAIGYDYCGKPCNDPSRIVCAYNQRCYTYFTSPCEMKKRNCDYDDRFLETPFSSCLLGSQCRGI